VKRMIKVMAIATLMTVILVASVSPAMARRAAGGHPMSTEKPCEVTPKDENGPGAHFEERPESDVALCWLVFPTHNQ
jgi:hypothetical protein